jgi:hypothetical protein
MSVPTSSGQHVLMKDQSKIKKAVRQTTIVVNSRDRNYMAYPDSNHFRYTLRRPLTNVMSIELMNGSVPAFLYTIQPSWGSFSFCEWSHGFSKCNQPPVSTVILTPGFYTEEDLCKELELQLNNICGRNNTYEVTLNPHTKKLSVAATNSKILPFSFLFFSGEKRDEIDLNTLAILSINTPARFLGFGLSDYNSDPCGMLHAPLPMDLENFLNRMYLHLESDGKNLARMELGAGRPDCFHIFYIYPGQANYIYLDKETDHSTFVSSPSPIARMANLEITLRDEFNRLVDLHHRELSLVFEITHLE